MEVRNNVDGLKSFLGIGLAVPATGVASGSHVSGAAKPLAGDVASLSSLGAHMQQAGTESDVRAEKVASVRAALDAGTYQVSSATLAAKVVETMLQGNLKSGS